MRSLRNRLVVATLVASLAILLVAAALIYGLIRRSLIAEFDATLLAKTRAIAAAAEEDEGQFELDMQGAQMPEFRAGSGCEFFHVWNTEGGTLARSPSLADHALDLPGEVTEPHYRFLELPDGRPGRQVTLVTSIRTDPGSESVSPDQSAASAQARVTIAVARDTLDLAHTLGRLALLLVSVTLGAALLSVVALVAVAHITLTPISALATRIAEIDAANVADKGPLTCSIAELDPVVARLNELLDRLDKAFAREKAFTADVAHELRTPLAGLSIAMEVCASRPRDEAAYREVILKCLGTTRAMQSMVENLLALARADAGQLSVQKERFELLGLARDAWLSFAALAAQRELQVDWPDNDESVEVVTDPEKLRLVLRNLFDNAVRHANQGGTVTIIASQNVEQVVLEIRTTGCVLPPDDAEKVFARFWKHDAARTEGADHCGLGLPLCRRIVEALDGSISAVVENCTFAVTVALPRGTNKCMS